MKIEIKKDKLFYSGKYHNHFTVKASCQGALITDNDLSEGDLEIMITDIVQDSEILGDTHWSVIDKMLTLGWITEEQVYQWVEDNTDEQ